MHLACRQPKQTVHRVTWESVQILAYSADWRLPLVCVLHSVTCAVLNGYIGRFEYTGETHRDGSNRPHAHPFSKTLHWFSLRNEPHKYSKQNATLKYLCRRLIYEGKHTEGWYTHGYVSFSCPHYKLFAVLCWFNSAAPTEFWELCSVRLQRNPC